MKVIIYLNYLGPQVPCKWSQCSLLFDDTFTLQRHVLHDHMVLSSDNDYVCNWSHCSDQNYNFTTKDDWISHLRAHFYNPIGESCCNSPIIEEPSLSFSSSSSPSTPSSTTSCTTTNSSITTHQQQQQNPMIVDYSDIQGIALVAAHLLNWLSKDPASKGYFIPYEKDLSNIAEQRPRLAAHIWSICSNFKSASASQPLPTTVAMAESVDHSMLSVKEELVKPTPASKPLPATVSVAEMEDLPLVSVKEESMEL